MDVPVLPALAVLRRNLLGNSFTLHGISSAQRARGTDARLGDAALRTALRVLLLPPAHEVLHPMVAKTLLTAPRTHTYISIVLTKSKPLELARRSTLMEHTLFRAINPDMVFDMSGNVRRPVSVRRATGLILSDGSNILLPRGRRQEREPERHSETDAEASTYTEHHVFGSKVSQPSCMSSLLVSSALHRYSRLMGRMGEQKSRRWVSRRGSRLNIGGPGFGAMNLDS
jgi:hypothetical protein